MLQVGGNMAQKLQAMQQGVHQLREVTQICQSVVAAGPAGGDSVASQHSQRGWHLAKKCNGWANEVQACSHPHCACKLMLGVACCI